MCIKLKNHQIKNRRELIYINIFILILHSIYLLKNNILRKVSNIQRIFKKNRKKSISAEKKNYDKLQLLPNKSK